jgi:hypothetical protein
MAEAQGQCVHVLVQCLDRPDVSSIQSRSAEGGDRIPSYLVAQGRKTSEQFPLGQLYRAAAGREELNLQQSGGGASWSGPRPVGAVHLSIGQSDSLWLLGADTRYHRGWIHACRMYTFRLR